MAEADPALKAARFGAYRLDMDPTLKPLRSERRFPDLLRRVGFQPK